MIWDFYVPLDLIYLPMSGGRSIAVHPVHIHRVSVKWGRNQGWEHGRNQGEQKSFIPFCNFSIVNKLLIIRNCRINPAYCKRATRCLAIVVVRRARNCLLQAAMATTSGMKLNPRSEL